MHCLAKQSQHFNSTDLYGSGLNFNVRKVQSKETCLRVSSPKSENDVINDSPSCQNRNTMLNKVGLFVIFGAKCIFDASKHCNNPLMSHDYFDDVFISFLDSIPYTHFQWRDRKLSIS